MLTIIVGAVVAVVAFVAGVLVGRANPKMTEKLIAKVKALEGDVFKRG
jgi:hypothetical protein